MLGILSIKNFSLAANEIPLQDGDITTRITPENPEPYQDVTVSLVSFAIDLNKAMIEWQNGSKTVLSGYGKTSYSFKALGPNTVNVIDVTITPPDSLEKITKRVTVAPSEVELIWEGVDSYTPPFYRGKSFPSAGGRIKVVAVPNTTSIKQGKGSVSYTWKSGDKTIEGVSGYNKDSFVFTNSEVASREKISVRAESIDGNYAATNTIEIPIINPKIVFYKKSPSEGISYSNALGNEATFIGDEMTVVAEPYFLSLRGREGNFTYAWKINGESIPTPSTKTELTVRPTERGGYATISLTLENLRTLFQKVTSELKLNL
jgi:hypothetical protein